MNRTPPAGFDPAFYRGRRVFVTGHTGFKGSWLCIWLHSLGATAAGYALKPPTKPSLFELARVGRMMDSVTADIRNLAALTAAMKRFRPEVVFHLAAQPLVRRSYAEPVETFSTNVMGTVNILEAVRRCPSVRAAVVVTTDKCYEERRSTRGYSETERLGGRDPYSSSKACAELASSAYRDSFFNGKGTPAVATVRAGNVIGGGDWAQDRLFPDCLNAFLKGGIVLIRNPRAVRPWQHVLEPLSGYLLLAEKLATKGRAFSSAWNFGPERSDARPVAEVVALLCRLWGGKAGFRLDRGSHPHETGCLRLDCSKSRRLLGWRPRLRLLEAVRKTVAWTKAYRQGEDPFVVCLSQIREFME